MEKCDFDNNLDQITLDYCEIINDTEPPVITLTPTNNVVGATYPSGQSYFELKMVIGRRQAFNIMLIMDGPPFLFMESFNTVPIILTQVVSENESHSVVTRIRNYQRQGFRSN